MSKKVLIIIISAIILVVVIGAVVYYFSSNKNNIVKQIGNTVSQNTNQSANNVAPVQKPPTPQEQTAQINKDYSQKIRGVINFDTSKAMKTTIKSDDGKIYTLWPPQSSPIYESFGVKNGQRVEIQGKLNSQGNLEWVTLKSI